MPRTNSLISTNTSGVPGLALRTRKGHQVIDCIWNDPTDGRRRATSYLLSPAGPVEAVARAMQRRQGATGVPYDITPRQAWNRLRKAGA